MKGTDQEYSSALTQYNSSANSGGEDIELLAFQTVTGQSTVAPRRLWTALAVMWSGPRPLDWREINNSVQGSVVRPSSRTCGSRQRNPCTWRARWSMSPSGTPSSSWGRPCKTTANRPTLSFLPGCIYLSKPPPGQVTTVMRSGVGSSTWCQVEGEDRTAAIVLYSLQTCKLRAFT